MFVVKKGVNLILSLADRCLSLSLLLRDFIGGGDIFEYVL